MDLFEAVNNACRDLPAGYIVNLGMENGAAWVELTRPPSSLLSGRMDNREYGLSGFTEDIDGADGTLAEQIQLAVNIAIEAEKDFDQGKEL